MIKQNDLLDTLKSAGMRITPQRIAICHALATSELHPTASELYDEIKKEYPSLSLATVYNTLDILVAHGKVNVLGDAGDGKVHFDANTDPHMNLACIKCHTVIDIRSNHVHQMNEEIKSHSGYQVLGSRVIYYGICPDCQAL